MEARKRRFQAASRPDPKYVCTPSSSRRGIFHPIVHNQMRRRMMSTGRASWRSWAQGLVVDAADDRLPAGTWWAPLVYASLAGASVVYGSGKACVDLMYSSGILRAKRLPVPVISVGNITWGGTGKTPMVIFLAELVAKRGGRALVLARGYGGDEDKMLHSRLRGVAAVACGSDRHAAASLVLSSPAGRGVTCVILDDGLQHHRLERDAHIVMVNCLAPWGSNALLPRGPLRVPWGEGVAKADLLVLHNGWFCCTTDAVVLIPSSPISTHHSAPV